jgi:hypothetical protein
MKEAKPMFCPKCGANAGDARFCPACGARLDTYAGFAGPSSVAEDVEIVFWEGKPTGIGDKMKGFLNTTYYKITNQRIVIGGGLIGKHEDDIEIRDIQDVKFTASLTDRMAGVGDITLLTKDPLRGNVVLTNIPNAREAREFIRKSMIEFRAKSNVMYRDTL